MNDYQEAILDRLMVVDKVGSRWNTGPFGVALEALRQKKLIYRGDATKALGFPMIFCQAVQGACMALSDADDRRRLAVTIFSEVPPRGTPMRLAARRHLELGLWCARRVHPLACVSDCPYLLSVEKCVQERMGVRVQRFRSWPSGQDKCLAAAASRGQWPGSCTTPPWFVLYILQTTAFLPQVHPGHHTNRIGLLAGRVTAQKGGERGALQFCLALARELKLTP